MNVKGRITERQIDNGNFITIYEKNEVSETFLSNH
jgi:hypothetical protein